MIRKFYDMDCTILGGEIERPPLGLMPRRIIDQKRKMQINEAISRYNGSDKCIPIEWVEELNEIIERQNNYKPQNGIEEGHFQTEQLN